MSPDLEQMFTAAIREIDTKISNLARPEGRAETRKLLAERDRLSQVSQMASGAPDPRRYVDIPAPIKAIEAFLDDQQEPRTEDEIVDGVLSGGWRGGKRQYVSTLHRSVAVFTSPIGRGTNSKDAPLKMIGDRIGLKAWEDERWQ